MKASSLFAAALCALGTAHAQAPAKPAATAPAASAPAAASTSVKATVNGMVCAFCAQGIEKTLTKMPEAQAVYVNLDQKLVAVDAKPGKTLDHEKIKKAIVDAGFDVIKIEQTADKVEAIKRAAKAKA